MEIANRREGDETAPRVVVVDPWPLLRGAVAELLRDSGAAEVVGTAATGAAAWELCRRTHPDLVVTDADLCAAGDGLRLGRRLKRAARSPRVLVYAGSCEPGVVVECLGGAADGFVHRSAEPQALVAAVRGLAAGQPVWIVGAPGQDGPARPAERGGPAGAVNGALDGGLDGGLLRAMTGREQEVLGLLLRRYSNDEIADELCLARQTVKNYVSNVLQKLEVSSRRQLYGLIPARAA